MASTSKGKGGIRTSSWNKHTDKKTSRVHNKKVRKDGKKAAKEEDEEVFVPGALNRSHYLNFISELVAENFSQAHKYLRAIVNHKIKARIKNQLSKPLF